MSAIVAVPARNEAARIGRCLDALMFQVDAPDVGVVVLLNDCSDRSFETAVAAVQRSKFPIRIYDVVMDGGARHAGGARRAAMELGAAWLDQSAGALLLTTDADSVPQPDWVSANRRAVAHGADCVAGRLELDCEDAKALPDELHARGSLEARYETLLTEMYCYLDPRPHDPWPRHACEPGASLAVTLRAYRMVGGLPGVPFGEDRALVAALEERTLRVRHDPAVCVVTSGRTVGRAEGGVADTLRLRCSRPDAPCDPYLEPASNAWTRGLWRGRLRALHARGLLHPSRQWREALHLRPDEICKDASATSFAAFWRALESKSSVLARYPLRPRDLLQNIHEVELLLKDMTCRRETSPTGHTDQP